MTDKKLELRLNQEDDKLEEAKVEEIEVEKSQQPEESNIPTLQPLKRSHEEEEGSSNLTPEMNIEIKRLKLTAKSIPNWLIEVLAWIKRIEMADSKLSTASWTFKQLCWPKLHGNVKAHQVRLTSLYEQDRETLNLRSKLCKGYVHSSHWRSDEHILIPIANIDPPKYITGFKGIDLYFLDGQILEFLKNMLPFMDTIRLHFRCEITEWHAKNIRIGPIRRLLSMLAPKIYGLTLFDTRTNLCDFNRLFPGYIQEMQSIELDFPRRAEFDLLIEWLNTERADGKPKMFTSLLGVADATRDDFVERVKEEFLLSKRKTAFIIDLGFAYTEDLTFENETTGELLSIYQGEHWDEDYKDEKEQYLVRHPKGMEHMRTSWEKKFACDDKEYKYTNVIVEIEEIGLF